MTSTHGTRTYAIDPVHSYIEFSLRHLMVATFRGRFTDFTGSVTIPDGSQVPSAVEGSVAAASLSTHDPRRDGHLLGPDFLNAEAFPKVEFRSTTITGQPNAFEIAGDFTFRGVTKSVTFRGSCGGRIKDMQGNDRIGFDAVATIDRNDFGLKWNQVLEGGAVMLGDDVKIELSVEAVAKP